MDFINDAAILREMTALTRKGDARKLQLVEAAIACLGEAKLNALTFEAVGKRLEIGKSHVAYHFPDLDILLQNCVEYVYATGQAIVGEYLSIHAKKMDPLKAYIDGTFHWLEKYPAHCAVCLLLLEKAMREPWYTQFQTQVRKIGKERLHAILKSKYPTCPEDHLKLLSAEAHNLLAGHVLYYFSTERKHSFKKEAGVTFQAITRIFGEST